MRSFIARRAIERLRDGLFDQYAVDYLTVDDEIVTAAFLKGLHEFEGSPMCLCGSYGQGKSHTLTRLCTIAKRDQYATSFVHLDIRERPFSQFSLIYRSIMESMALPDGTPFIEALIHHKKDLHEILDEFPHRFVMILHGLFCVTSAMKNEAYILKQALMGHEMRISSLRSALKACQVDGYQRESLAIRGNLPYVQMIQCVSQIIQAMGYKGLVLFFDEAESLAQLTVRQRVKGYEVLDLLFIQKNAFFPVFAFTDDFFVKVAGEAYEGECSLFPKKYAEEWKNLPITRLQEFSSSVWPCIQTRLIDLYENAFQVRIERDRICHIQNMPNHEIRLKIKSFIHQLDIETS